MVWSDIGWLRWPVTTLQPCGGSLFSCGGSLFGCNSCSVVFCRVLSCSDGYSGGDSRVEGSHLGGNRRVADSVWCGQSWGTSSLVVTVL